MGGIGSGGARDGAGRKTIDGEPSARISVSIPTGMLSHIRDTADRRKISVSQYITDLLTKSIDQ